MDYELKNILHDDCYGLGKIEGSVGTVLDVGGNLGFFSLAARSRFPHARIHCYEPNPDIQDYLLNNTRELSIEVHPEAVGAQDGRIELNTENGSLFSTAVASEKGTIKQTGIGNAIARLGGKVDLLKLDCEGAEWEIFKQAEIWRHVNNLTLEYHLWASPGTDVCGLLKTVREFGFRITHLFESPEIKWGILQAVRIK